jgi:hypothetical protein
MNRSENDLERELKNALARRQPTPGLTERILARIDEPQEGIWSRLISSFGLPVMRWAVAFVVIVAVGVGSVAYQRHQQEMARGLAAKQQLMIALHIAGSKLQSAQYKVHNIGTGRGTQDPSGTENR